MPVSLCLSLLCLLLLVCPAQAQVSARTTEFQVFNLINQYRQRMKISPLRFSRQASEVAREHSRDMAQYRYFDLYSPRRGTIDYQLSYGRVAGRALNTMIVQDYSVPELLSQLQKNTHVLDPQATHAGIGLHMKDPEHPDKGLWLTVVYLEFLAELQPLPRTVRQGDVLRVEGEVFPPYLRPRMPVTQPNGQVRTYFSLQGPERKFSFEIPFQQGKGRYELELLVDQPGSGPRVAMILPVYADQAYPAEGPSPSPVQESVQTPREAARRVLRLLNQERRRYHLQALEEDERLNAVARAHSEDMGRNHYFAHINLRGEDPVARLSRAGGQGTIGENIALDLSLEGAHRRLMNSPGHRANMLDPDFTHVGIGVFFNGSHYYITQLFQKQSGA
jgi:uncharacterized protein YkwD